MNIELLFEEPGILIILSVILILLPVIQYIWLFHYCAEAQEGKYWENHREEWEKLMQEQIDIMNDPSATERFTIAERGPKESKYSEGDREKWEKFKKAISDINKFD